LNLDRPGCVRSVGVEMKPIKVEIKLTGIADTDVAEKMRHIKVKMKPIRGRNLNAQVKMNETGVADLDAGVKMKPTE
jgi:hypothetical protein